MTLSHERRTIIMGANYTMDIDKLIQYLKEEKSLGATKVTLWGTSTLISDHNNSVIITTEQQI